MMAALALVAKATFILVAALIASRLVRRSSASTRALILTSSFGVLLALPVMEVVLPSRPIEVELLQLVPGLESMVAPLATGTVPPPAIVNSHPRGSSPEPSRLPKPATIVWCVWAIGACFLAARLGAGLVRLRSLRQTGERWGDAAAATILQQATSRRVHLFLHTELTSPMTCGIAEPSIGLPIEAREWSATELRQALIHEAEHIRRGDWVVLVLSRVACSLYWFQPLVWIAARRLNLESEYACDDAVVRVGERASYAQQLVSMARRLSEGVSHPALPMADRRDLAKRVDAVLNHARPRTQLRTWTVAATTIATLLVSAAIAPWRPAAAQSGGAVEDVLPIPMALTGKAFSQVSIGSADGTGSPLAFDTKTGVFTARNTTLLGLISYAYAAVPRTEPVAWEPFEVNDQRITGAPEWMQTERFDIDAKTNPGATAEELHAMLRRLLRDSFDLSVRDETRQTPAYRMVRIGTAGSSAPGLQPGNQDCADRWNMEGGGPGHIVRRCITLAEFAAEFTLAEVLGRPVVDRTGISGVFNLSLVHAPTSDELATVYELSPSDLPRELFDRPSIFTAMEQQLGLRLESTRGVVHTLAIESATRPTQIR
jgi:uncharacterized protein (TIGR03435 family)